MSEITTEHYIGSGIVYVDGRDVGNASEVKVDIEQETKSAPNYRGGGGNAAEQTLVKAVNLSLKLHDYNNANLALALRGKVQAVNSVTVTDEVLNANLNGLAETSKPIDLSQPVTVKNASSGAVYVLDVDYVLSSAGIRALSSGSIAANAELKVSYKSLAGSVLQALVDSGVTVRVVVDGVNDATGKRFVLTFFKWKPAPTSGLDVITDDFAEFDIKGGVLADTSKVGATTSKFFTRIAQA